ncbi:MAG: SIS domain-containing protein [Bacteroidota bacterium]
MSKQLQDWIAQEIEAIKNIPLDGNIEKAVDLIHHQVKKAGGKVVVSGVGKAGNIGMKIASTFSSAGIPSVFLPALEAQHGELGLLQPNDILFLISNSGLTSEIVDLHHLAKALYEDIPTILLTGQPASALGQESEVCIATGPTKEICPLGLTPTTSTTVMSVIGDLLVASLIQKQNYSRSEYGKRHHSGYLGKKARD